MFRMIFSPQFRVRGFEGLLSLSMNHGSPLRSEPLFHEMLRLEEKRSARSGRPILLALLDVSNHLGSPRAFEVIQELEKALSCALRETDVKGWYREGSVIGILFTDTGIINELTKSKILLKIHKALYESLGPVANAEVETSFHLLPGSYDNGTGSEKGWKEDGHRHLETVTEDEAVGAVSGGCVLER